ncbi:MAG: type IV secretion system protein, partial [Peptococcaceae bacterium]|nr:type IV secretion system protein [Peptococcaceae bacterium]
MMIKILRVTASLIIVLACWPAAGWAQAGKPVMDAAVSLLPDNNIVRVSWAPQAGVGQYTVERWEAQGTDYWHFDINDTMKSTDQTLKIRGMELERKVFVHPANPGRMVELYDQDVKPGYTYFYRINGGRIAVVETRKKPVVSLTEEEKEEIGARQAAEQAEIDREGGGRSWSERARAYEQSADYPERLAADLIMAIPNWLIEVIGLHDPLELVFEIDLPESFNKEGGPAVARKDLVWNIYNQDEFRVISDFYNHIRQAAPVFMAAGIAVAGMLVLFGSTNSQSAIAARGYITGILLCALLLKLGPYLLGFFFDVNRAVVAVCHGAVADQVHQSFLHSIYNEETRSIGSALMALIACLSIGVINFQFAVRKVFIAILVGILPIVLINAIYPGRRNALAVWTREFASYVFMPACFAVGLAFFIHFINSDQFWVTLVCLLSLPAINSLVRGVRGLSDAGFTAGVGSTLG